MLSTAQKQDVCVCYMPYVCKYAIINCDSKIVYDSYRTI